MFATSAHLCCRFGIDGTSGEFFLVPTQWPKTARTVPDAMVACNTAYPASCEEGLRPEGNRFLWKKPPGSVVARVARDEAAIPMAKPRPKWWVAGLTPHAEGLS